jgi:CheY-like chemotaxis protein
MHGGTVRVESLGLGMGTTFFVNFPIAALTLVPGQEDGREASNLPGALEGLRALVVDDEPDAREILTLVLEGFGLETECASSALEAVAKVESYRPDVIVSDIGMPVRSLPPDQGGEIPAIALTAYGSAEDRARALECGYRFHLAKPAEPAELAQAIAVATGRAGKAFSA